MTPRVHVYTIAWQEAEMMPYFLRHYSTFADKIIVFCEPSTDGTENIVKACPKAELRKWPFRGLDDNRFIEAVNEWWKESRGKADWVMWPDVDEFLYNPDPMKILSETKADVLQTTGYGMVSVSPLVKSDVQLYAKYRTGIRQPNYDKAIIWKPQIDIQHTHGRHTYSNKWPQHNGVQVMSDFKLLHYHYFGVDYTAMRNRRNFGRAVDKKFAWNYSPEHNSNPNQVGSVAWVRSAIEQNKLVDVISGDGKPVMKKLHFGCGGHLLPTWENFDAEIDIRQKLPFPDESASHIYASHVVEHVTFQEAWNFFAECRRVLAPNGIMRIAIPDLAKMDRDMTQEYQEAVKKGGHGDGSKQSALKACVFSHGHQSVWTRELLGTVLEAVGFTTRHCDYGSSSHPELIGVETHGRTVGDNVARVETSVVEGIKA